MKSLGNGFDDNLIEDMTADFKQQQLGAYMNLDVVKEQHPEIFLRDIGDPFDYDIYVEDQSKDMTEAEIAAVQADQNFKNISENMVSASGTKENRKLLLEADSYSQKISNIVSDLLSAQYIEKDLKELSEMKDIILSYDVPKGFESYKISALKHIARANILALDYRQETERERDYTWEERDKYQAKELMGFIEAEQDRLYQIEKFGDFGDMSSDEIQQYAEAQLDIAQEKLFDDTISDEEAFRGLNNALLAVKELPKVIKEEEEQARIEDQELSDYFWENVGSSLSETHLTMCFLLSEDYLNVNLESIKMFYEEHSEDYDKVDDNIGKYSVYLTDNNFTDSRAVCENYIYGEDEVQNIKSDLEQTISDLCEDFPFVNASIIEKIYNLSPNDFDMVQDRVNNFNISLENNRWQDQEEMFYNFVYVVSSDSKIKSKKVGVFSKIKNIFS